MIFKHLYQHSPTDYGTLNQLRNLINRRNVVKTPKDDVNACDDFFRLVLQCHVIVAAIKVLGIETQTPSPPDRLKPENISSCSADQRKAILKLYARAVVDGFTNLDLHDRASDSHTLLCYDDKGLGYAIELLTLGLLYVEFTDAVKEGDGLRIHRCWKFMFPLFKASGRTNYTIEIFTTLYNYTFLLSPRQAEQLLWSRFVNTSGRPGKNIPMDLHMEHLNRICKDAISGLGANKTPAAIQRIGKCVGVVQSVNDNFDEQTKVNEAKGYHTVSSVDKDKDIIIKELLSHAIFSPTPGRCHSAFKTMDRSLFSKVSYGLMLQWMNEHVPK